MNTKHLIPAAVSLALLILCVALTAHQGAGLFAAPNIDIKVATQQEIISAAYKAYGTPQTGLFVAKAVIENQSALPLRRFQIQYQLDGLTGWSTPSKYSEILPGQMVVDLYFPTLPPALATESSARTVNFNARWYFESATGRSYEDSANRPLKTLGVNSLTWSSLPDDEMLGWFDNFANYLLIGAFVTPNEEVAKTFSVNATKGLNTTTDDQDSLEAFARAFYALRNWGVGYIQEPTDAWSARFTQYVQFPKDSIMRKAGTCIDLAILLSSLMEAVGIDSLVILGPGHAIPAIRLSSGDIVPVESTFIDRQYAYSHFSNVVSPRVLFEECRDLAIQTVQGWMKDGRIIFMSPKEAWKLGVVPPW